MTTAYVVTQGSFSDYSIVKVFLDKEKAERFVDIYSRGSYDDPRIEEHEIEERDTTSLYQVYFEWYPARNAFNFQIREYADIAVGFNPQSFNEIFMNGFPTFDSLVNLQRVFHTPPDKEKLEKRLQKAAQDIWAQMQEKTQVEGLTIDQVNQWLKGLPIEGEVSDDA